MDASVENDMLQKAESGDLNAQIQLGRFYQHRNNMSKALKYYEMALAQNQSKEIYLSMAEIRVKCKQINEVLLCYEKLVKLGNKRCYLEMGRLCLRNKDVKKARHYFLKAKEAGIKGADNFLKEIDAPLNIMELKELFLLKKNKDVAFRLGRYYYETNKKEAAFWYHHGYTDPHICPLVKAQILTIFGDDKYSPHKIKEAQDVNTPLSKMFLQSYEKTLKEIEKFEKTLGDCNDCDQLIAIGEKYESLGNYTKALYYYYKSADLGSLEAESKVAGILMKNNETATGLRWLERATMKGSMTALHRLGKYYKESENTDKQIECYLKIISLGDNTVSYELGKLYQEKLLFAKAVEYYKMARTVAQNSLSFIEEPDKNLIRNIDDRIRLMNKFDALGQNQVERLETIFQTYKSHAKQAAIGLGTLYYLGEECEKDYEKSAYWYNLAYESSCFSNI